MSSVELKTVAQTALADCVDPTTGATEYEFARAVICVAQYAGVKLATAESLTGGMFAELLTSVPGASNVYRGGVVAYSTDLKQQLLQVDAGLLAQRGPVDADVALQMACGVAARLGADLGLACTGVAGPTELAGHRVGEVHIAGFDARAKLARGKSLQFDGTRADIRVQTCIALAGLALDLLVGQTDLERNPKLPCE